MVAVGSSAGNDFVTQREGASTAHAPKHGKLQKMCQESEAWDEALRIAPRRGEHEAARAKLSAQIESNSCTDYLKVPNVASLGNICTAH